MIAYNGIYKNNPSYEIASVGFYLGNKCNFNCVYCRDKGFRPHKEVIDSDLDILFNFFDAKLKSLTKLTLIGGEPFMYMKYIPKIYEYCHNRDIGLYFISNGLGIKNDNIWYDFVKDKDDVRIQISYDGDSSNRGHDIFDDKKIVDRANHLLERNRLGLYSVITDTNWNVVEIFSKILNYFGDRAFGWNFAPVMRVAGVEPTIKMTENFPIEPYILSLYTLLSLYKEYKMPRYLLLRHLGYFKRQDDKAEIFMDSEGNILSSYGDFSIIGKWYHDDKLCSDIELTDIYNKINHNSLNQYTPLCTGCYLNDICHKRPEYHKAPYNIDNSCISLYTYNKVILDLMREANCRTLDEFDNYLRYGM